MMGAPTPAGNFPVSTQTAVLIDHKMLKVHGLPGNSTHVKRTPSRPAGPIVMRTSCEKSTCVQSGRPGLTILPGGITGVRRPAGNVALAPTGHARNAGTGGRRCLDNFREKSLPGRPFQVTELVTSSGLITLTYPGIRIAITRYRISYLMFGYRSRNG